MQELLLGIWEAERKTVMFVTHDIDEAIFMANRVPCSARARAASGRYPREPAASAPLHGQDLARVHGAESPLTEEIRAESLAAAAH